MESLTRLLVLRLPSVMHSAREKLLAFSAWILALIVAGPRGHALSGSLRRSLAASA